MAITIYLNISNVSLQVGDALWRTPTNTVGDRKYAQEPQYVGIVSEVGNDFVKVTDEQSVPSAHDFLMFQKNKMVNNTSLIGYYAEVELKNNSLEHAELFAVGSEVAPSSK